ncbi:MAG: type II toxin-antitoxin system VapC family toxin [Kiritimatiellia bacterium]
MTTTEDDKVFVDTNVLLAATDTSREKHAEAITFLDEGLKGEIRLFVISQIIREYMVVATRPVEVNGLGLPLLDAVENVRKFKSFIQMLPDDDETAQELLSLISKHDLKGKRIHDANLVASMARHGLRILKTFNRADFEVFAERIVMA